MLLFRHVYKENKVVEKRLARNSLLVFLIPLLLLSCNDNYSLRSVQEKDVTILFYIVAENNLYSFADTLLMDLSKVDTTLTKGVNIIAYVDDYHEPRLLLLNNSKWKLLRMYDECNSVSEAVVRDVTSFKFNKFPAKEKGLVLWSHGTGWFPVNVGTRSFGDDNGEANNMFCIVRAVPCRLDFMVLDACYMGCVETMFDVRNVCRYCVASPCQVPNKGIIGQRSLECLLDTEKGLEERLVSVCDEYANRYDSLQEPVSVSLVKADAIDVFADKIKTIETFGTLVDYAGLPVIKYRNFDVFYDLEVFFDMVEFQCSSLVDDIVVHKSKSRQFPYGNFGLSVFLPDKHNVDYQEAYESIPWNVETGWLRKFCVQY